MSQVTPSNLRAVGYEPLPVSSRAQEQDHELVDGDAFEGTRTSLRPLGNAALQAVATGGALISGLALAARSTHGADPLHNRYAAGAGAMSFAVASGMQLGLAAQQASAAQFRSLANKLLATGFCAMGAAQLQGGLDGRGFGGVTAGGAALMTGLLAQLGLVGAQLRDDQRTWGNTPVPQAAPRSSVVAASLTSVSALMAGAGMLLGLRARGEAHELEGLAWLSMTALASLPLIAGMAVATRVPRRAAAAAV